MYYPALDSDAPDELYSEFCVEPLMFTLTVLLEANQVYYTTFLGDFLQPCLLGSLVFVMILKGKGEVGMDS